MKEDAYKIKFETLGPWTQAIFQAIKKELRNDHLLKNPGFVQKHFPKRAIDKLTTEDYAVAYLQEIGAGNEELGDVVAVRWVMKNAELYQFFVTELTKINPQYDEITAFSPGVGEALLRFSIEQFGAIATYIFSILNAVVFSAEQMQMLRQLALDEKDAKPSGETAALPTIEELKQHYEREIRKLSEKYEKRLQGVERKYFQDVEGLKKQIAQLHKKLGAAACGS